jgi:hypothetical protein
MAVDISSIPLIYQQQDKKLPVNSGPNQHLNFDFWGKPPELPRLYSYPSSGAKDSLGSCRLQIGFSFSFYSSWMGLLPYFLFIPSLTWVRYVANLGDMFLG